MTDIASTNTNSISTIKYNLRLLEECDIEHTIKWAHIQRIVYFNKRSETSALEHVTLDELKYCVWKYKPGVV